MILPYDVNVVKDYYRGVMRDVTEKVVNGVENGPEDVLNTIIVTLGMMTAEIIAVNGDFSWRNIVKERLDVAINSFLVLKLDEVEKVIKEMGGARNE